MAAGDGSREGMPLDVAFRGQSGARARGPGGWVVQGGESGLPRVQFTVDLPTVSRPPSATDFNMFGTLAGRTAVNTTPNNPGAIFPGAFQIPANNVGAIKSISILANNLLVTSNVLWRLRFNGAYVQGWNALTINPRAAGSVEVSWTPEETAIPVPESAVIDMVTQVLDLGTYQLSFSIHGWFFSTGLAAVAQAAGW